MEAGMEMLQKREGDRSGPAAVRRTRSVTFTAGSEALPALGERTLGSGSGSAALTVSEIGFGCMGLTYHRGPALREREAERLLCEAADAGCTLFDTAEIYGPYENERLVGAALAPIRDKVRIATKFGLAPERGGALDSSPAAVRRSCEGSLRRLGIEAIDLYYQHRTDPSVPIEETAGAVADLIREGKVKHFGLSEADAETVRRAHAVCPVTAVQSELSLMWREPETDLFPVLEELGIGFVPYSPICRGFLGGGITAQTVFAAENDNRRELPRFQPENRAANLRLTELLRDFGRAHGMTPAQAALAWLLGKAPWIVPIPGTQQRAHLLENLRAAAFSVGADDWRRLEAAAQVLPIAGERYGAAEAALTAHGRASMMK